VKVVGRHARDATRFGERGIAVEGLHKVLRGRTILNGLNLRVPPGTISVIQGDNGAGKTTLVRILATVVSPDGGTARVAGYDVVRQSLAVRRAIGVSFASERSLYWRISGLQNLELFGRIAGLTKPAIAARAATLCADLRLQDVATERVARMSTGQRQRLMVARALLTEPSVLLLDEPFRGLDGDGLHALVTLLATRAARGTTVLVVAPLIDPLVDTADALWRMVDGGLAPLTPGEVQR
jgi:ABC-type multidrug transport system ATPase subunit